jgi:retron-type reverse transcriptase
MGGKTPYWMYRRRHKTAQQAYEERRERRRQQMGHTVWPVTAGSIIDSDYLLETYKKCRQGGQAAGIDKITYAELSNSEVGEIVRKLTPVLQNETYKPHPTRPVSIPKPGKPEPRKLNLGVIFDRVVAKALERRMKLLWEPTFLDCSYGSREGRNAWKMLAALEVQMVTQDRWVLMTADLKSAFDNLPVEEVLESHRKLLDSLPLPKDKKEKAEAGKERQRLLRLVETVVRGHHTSRTRGVDQGNPASPMSLNGVLHFRLDEPILAELEAPLCWFRYTDNTAYAAQSVKEGRTVLRKMRRLLKPLGLSVHESSVTDLAKGKVAQLLGFSLHKEGNMVVYGLGKKALEHLAQNLAECHDDDNPTEAARKSLLGWVDSLGPAFQNGVTEIPAILRLAAEYGFRELASPEELRRHWELAWGRWRDIRDREYRRRQGLPLLREAPPSLPTVSCK